MPAGVSAAAVSEGKHSGLSGHTPQTGEAVAIPESIIISADSPDIANNWTGVSINDITNSIGPLNNRLTQRLAASDQL